MPQADCINSSVNEGRIFLFTPFVSIWKTAVRYSTKKGTDLVGVDGQFRAEGHEQVVEVGVVDGGIVGGYLEALQLP